MHMRENILSQVPCYLSLRLLTGFSSPQRFFLCVAAILHLNLTLPFIRFHLLAECFLKLNILCASYWVFEGCLFLQFIASKNVPHAVFIIFTPFSRGSKPFHIIKWVYHLGNEWEERERASIGKSAWGRPGDSLECWFPCLQEPHISGLPQTFSPFSLPLLPS